MLHPPVDASAQTCLTLSTAANSMKNKKTAQEIPDALLIATTAFPL
jgi:hypothetical protein